MDRLGRFFRLAAAIALVVLASCRSQQGASSTPESSVRPGVNSEYLKTNLDVGQWVERFEREGREIYDQRDAILRAVGLRPGMRVADVGSGTGLFTLPFARTVGSGGAVYAVDIVPAFLDHIARRAKAEELPQIRTVLCSERSVELPRDCIDVAFICDAYHHFEYPQSTMASLLRALRPGGTLILVEFRRIEGQSSEWILNHVRAGEEVFTREIEAAGFEKVGEESFLKENYLLRFRRKA